MKNMVAFLVAAGIATAVFAEPRPVQGFVLDVDSHDVITLVSHGLEWKGTAREDNKDFIFYARDPKNAARYWVMVSFFKGHCWLNKSAIMGFEVECPDVNKYRRISIATYDKFFGQGQSREVPVDSARWKTAFPDSLFFKWNAMRCAVR